MNYWELPSTNKFLLYIVEEIRKGNNLVLTTPIFPPDGLVNAIGNSLVNSNFRDYEELSMDDTGHPLDQLCNYFLSGDTERRNSISALIKKLKPGNVYLIYKIDPNNYKHWENFMSDYESSSRNLSVHDRPLLILIISGIFYKDLKFDGPALKHIPWDDIFRDIDIQVYVDDLYFLDKSKTPFLQQISSRVICNLSLWDTRLADELFKISVDELFSPIQALKSIYEKESFGKTFSLNWISGGVMKFNGSINNHTYFFLSDEATYAEIETRIWAAQAAIIFPMIEKHRRKIIEMYKAQFKIDKFPYMIGDYKINDVYDFEIGPLSIVVSDAKLPKPVIDKVHKLRIIRNKLAHLELISVDDVQFLDPANFNI
jgi:hypothetical protein